MRSSAIYASVVFIHQVTSGIARHKKFLFISSNKLSARDKYRNVLQRRWNSAVPHESWFDDAPTATTTALNPLTKRLIKIGQPDTNNNDGKKVIKSQNWMNL